MRAVFDDFASVFTPFSRTEPETAPEPEPQPEPEPKTETETEAETETDCESPYLIRYGDSQSR